MARLEHAPQALDSLVEIGLYIAQQSGSLEIANQFLDSIDEKCLRYARQPMMGDPRPELGKDVRCFSLGNYVILYRPLNDGIAVLLVVHGARDIPMLFRKSFE